MPSSPVQRIAPICWRTGRTSGLAGTQSAVAGAIRMGIDHVAIGFYANAIGKFMAEG